MLFLLTHREESTINIFLYKFSLYSTPLFSTIYLATDKAT